MVVGEVTGLSVTALAVKAMSRACGDGGSVVAAVGVVVSVGVCTGPRSIKDSDDDDDEGAS